MYLRQSDRILKAHDNTLWRRLMPEIRAWRLALKNAAKNYQAGDWVVINNPTWKSPQTGQVARIHRTGYLTVNVVSETDRGYETFHVPATMLRRL